MAMGRAEGARRVMMAERVDLKELERKAYRSFFGDGIWDMYLGILLLALGVGGGISRLGVTWGYIIPDLHAITLALYLVSMVILIAGKRYITVPRLGAVRFGPARRARLSASVLILGGSAVLALVVFLAVSGEPRPGTWLRTPHIGLLAFTINVLVVFSLLAYYLDFRRLYGYAVLWAVAFPAAEWVSRNTEFGRAAAFLLVVPALAGVMLVTGAALLIRFLRSYPIPAGPATGSSR
jgi:hypothetical protein